MYGVQELDRLVFVDGEKTPLAGRRRLEEKLGSSIFYSRTVHTRAKEPAFLRVESIAKEYKFFWRKKPVYRC